MGPAGSEAGQGKRCREFFEGRPGAGAAGTGDHRVVCDPHELIYVWIFDAFPDDRGRQAHLSGQVAAALMAKAGELLAKPPSIEKIDLIAAKL